MRQKKEINIQIGEQVRLAREQAKMTQEVLAEKIEVSPQYISDFERGVVGIALPTLKKLVSFWAYPAIRSSLGREFRIEEVFCPTLATPYRRNSLPSCWK